MRGRTVRVLLAVGLVSTVAAAVWIGGSGTRRAAEQARRAVAERRYDDAEGLLRRWLAARPGAVEAHLLQAQIALARGRPAEAAEALGRAETLGAPSEQLDEVRGLLLVAVGRYDEAEPILRRALGRSNRPASELARALAEVGMATFRFGTAQEAIERWQRDAPDDAVPYLRLAEVRSRIGAEPERIAEAARLAVERDPSLAAAHLMLADALREVGRHAEAAEAYRDYLALAPEDPVGLTGAGRNALALGAEDEAVQLLDQALARDPAHAPALFERAGIDLARGDADAALARLDAAVKLEPDDPEIRYRRALALARLGRDDEARREREATERARRDNARLIELRDALVRNPHDLEIQSEIARWMIDHGHTAEGLRWAEKVLKARPDHPAACRLLAEYHQAAGEPGLANYYRTRAADK